ncbi:hypothetical protein MKZ38_006196 [Zalerion maritima]|uniref:Secreted protein n=1 Tax=Zalerion maritima TaxID=339359 RepID=A0AAD5RJ75_9PEZI|nr:hypothetical protein MKZ38_006196 [Zalerion maritima]
MQQKGLASLLPFAWVLVIGPVGISDGGARGCGGKRIPSMDTDTDADADCTDAVEEARVGKKVGDQTEHPRYRTTVAALRGTVREDDGGGATCAWGVFAYANAYALQHPMLHSIRGGRNAPASIPEHTAMHGTLGVESFFGLSTVEDRHKRPPRFSSTSACIFCKLLTRNSIAAFLSSVRDGGR